MKKVSTFFREHRSNIIFYVIFLSFFILVLVDLFYSHSFLKVLSDKGKDAYGDIADLHAVSMIILTLGLVWVAWFQLNGINETDQNDFLMRIDDRYGSLPIVKARTIIHRLYCQTRDKDVSQEIHIQKIAEKIKEMGLQENDASNFICLLNLLDFLETIAYFANRKSISKKDVSELLGGFLSYYYHVFEKWICYRRCKYKDNTYYCEIEKLVKEIERENY